MINKTNKYICKDCGREFSYSERSFSLKSERGRSRPERCVNCRQIHGNERKGVKIGYFNFEKYNSCDFGDFSQGYPKHEDRDLAVKSDELIISDSRFAISDKEVVSFYQELENNQVVVFSAPTGAGKSTFVPTRLIVPPMDYKGDLVERLLHQGQIIITEPLRSAVQRGPKFISGVLLKSSVGPDQIIGIRHASRTADREGEKYNDWNLIGVVTDGSLLNWIRDGKLNQYSLVMIDEAHQRSCNIETILMLLKNELPKYPALKIVICSATVNVSHFRKTFLEPGFSVGVLDLEKQIERKHNYFVHFWQDSTPKEDCDCWLCSGKTKREAFWKKREEKVSSKDLSWTVANFATSILKESENASILIFLWGERIINETADKLRRVKSKIDPKNEILVIPVYSRLGNEEVERCFNTKGKKGRVLLATDVAETGHTLPDVQYVIETGLARISEWDSQNQETNLPVVPISQDRCRQRWGRCGRTQKGYVYCFYTESEFEEMDEHISPEIVRSCLDNPILALNASGITARESIPWLLEDKDRKAIEEELERSIKQLAEKKLVSEKGYISEKALEIFHIPRSARDIDMISLAEEGCCGLETTMLNFLMRDRDGNSRVGKNLYDKEFGLFDWNPDWSVFSKMTVWNRQQRLKTGCKDDIDLLIRIISCFLKEEKVWSEYYSLNYDILSTALEEAKDSLQRVFRLKASEEERAFDLKLLNRIRECLFNKESPKFFKEEDFSVGSCPDIVAPKVRKKAGDMLQVEIVQAIGDPVIRSGWAIAKIGKDSLMPISFSDLSISSVGYGLNGLENQKVKLLLRGFDENGFPELTNVHNIFQDLRKIKEEISKSKDFTKRSDRRFSELEGFVAEINKEEESIVAVIPRKNGIFHPFEIPDSYLRGIESSDLKLGEKLTIRLFVRDGRDELPLSSLSDEDKDNLPQDWEIGESGKALIPFCLEDKDLEKWPAQPESLDFAKRHSWQYCLQARVVSSEASKQKLIERWEADISRYRLNIMRLREAIKRLEANIAKNRSRTIRTEEFRIRVQGWISEDEYKIRNKEVRINGLLTRIESTEKKIKDSLKQ